ncbi:MAG: hypothetical protein IME93_03635 [Proteobacteria bacterium]|nr:hypothetical protein [Pseudomonadota bacterium]
MAFVLWLWLGVGKQDQSINFILGLPSVNYLSVFPVMGALYAMAWTIPFKADVFGRKQGSIVSLLAFISVCTSLALYNGNLIVGTLAYMFFGFILFGWAMAYLGSLTGAYYEKHILNKAS